MSMDTKKNKVGISKKNFVMMHLQQAVIKFGILSQKDFDMSYFLPFIKGKKKVAYASSFVHRSILSNRWAEVFPW